MPTPSPPPSAGREVLEAFFSLFVGTVLQAGRCIAWLFLSAKRSATRRVYQEKALVMGQGMRRLAVGNEQLRQRVEALQGENTTGPRVDAAVLDLGKDGLNTIVPLPGLESEYEQGQQAAEAAREAKARADAMGDRIWPRSAIGWAGLIGSYLLTAYGLLLLVAWLAPTWAPVPLARLLAWRKAADNGEAPSTVAGNVTIRFVSAAIGQHELSQSGEVKRVGNMENNLKIVVAIVNNGSEEVRYESFRGKFVTGDTDGARLIDAEGKGLSRFVTKQDLAPEGGIKEATIPPGTSVEDVLIFSAPGPGFKSLELFLPAANIKQGKDAVKLTIPASLVEKPDKYK